MKYCIDSSKKAIKNGCVFDGLLVENISYFREIFLNPIYSLIKFEQDGVYGYVVFEAQESTFVFHLVNFTAFKTQGMTEHFIKDIAPIICFAFDLNTMQASVERKGMGRKLEKLGFKNIGQNIYTGDVDVL